MLHATYVCVQIIVHYEYKGKHHRQMCYCENTGEIKKENNCIYSMHIP